MIIESRSGVVDTSFPPNLMSDRRNTRAKGHTDRILWFLFDTFFIYLEIEYIIKKNTKLDHRGRNSDENNIYWWFVCMQAKESRTEPICKLKKEEYDIIENMRTFDKD